MYFHQASLPDTPPRCQTYSWYFPAELLVVWHLRRSPIPNSSCPHRSFLTFKKVQGATQTTTPETPICLITHTTQTEYNTLHTASKKHARTAHAPRTTHATHAPHDTFLILRCPFFLHPKASSVPTHEEHNLVRVRHETGCFPYF